QAPDNRLSSPDSSFAVFFSLPKVHSPMMCRAPECASLPSGDSQAEPLRDATRMAQQQSSFQRLADRNVVVRVHPPVGRAKQFRGGLGHFPIAPDDPTQWAHRLADSLWNPTLRRRDKPIQLDW